MPGSGFKRAANVSQSRKEKIKKMSAIY